MNKFIQNIAIIIAACTIAAPAYAYKYTFSNTTTKKILVGIHLNEQNPPLYKKLVEPGKEISFVQPKDFPSIKWGFCIQKIEYIVNPTEKQEKDVTVGPWKTGIFLALDEATYKKTMSALEADKKTDKSKMLRDLIEKHKASNPCFNREIAIVEDESGTLYFITKK